MKITIPMSLDGIVADLNGIGALLTAKEWHRAALVYAITKRPGKGTYVADLGNDNSIISKISCEEFARLGITGLSHHMTVAVYHDAWQFAINAGEAKPVNLGDEVELPSMPWPPTDPRTGSFQQRIVTQVRNAEPETRAQIACELLSEPEVAEQVVADNQVREVIEDIVGDDPAAVARINQKYSRRHPAPPRHEPERSPLTAAASLTAFSAWVAEGERVVSDVIADVMDGQADPALLVTPNKDLAVLLARLEVAANVSKDFDSAVADILNGGRQ